MQRKTMMFIKGKINLQNLPKGKIKILYNKHFWCVQIRYRFTFLIFQKKCYFRIIVQSLFLVSQMENIIYFWPPHQITYSKMASIFVNMPSMTRTVQDIKQPPFLEPQILLRSLESLIPYLQQMNFTDTMFFSQFHEIFRSVEFIYRYI